MPYTKHLWMIFHKILIDFSFPKTVNIMNFGQLFEIHSDFYRTNYALQLKKKFTTNDFALMANLAANFFKYLWQYVLEKNIEISALWSSKALAQWPQELMRERRVCAIIFCRDTFT